MSKTSDSNKKEVKRPVGGSPMAGERPKDFKNSIGKLFQYMMAFKWHLLIVVIAAIGSTVFVIIGPRLISSAINELFDGLIRKISGQGGIDFSRVGHLILMTLGLYAVASVFSFIQGWIMTNVTQQVVYNLRRDMSEKINHVPISYFESNPIGEILSRITNDIDTLGQSLNQSLNTTVSSLTMIIGVAIMMLSISPMMTLITLIILPISVLLVGMVLKFSQRYFRQQQKHLGVVNGQIEETFAGQLIVRAYNREQHVISDFEKENGLLYESGWKSQFFSGLLWPLMTFVGNLGYVLVVIAGSYLSIHGALTIGDIQAFVVYIRNFTQPITNLAQVINQVQSMAAAAERVFNFLEIDNESDTGTLEIPDDEIKGEVSFEHVKFGYDPNQTIINDFSIDVKPGQKIAIVGPTGAGKTTIVKLLLRFYDVDSGAIKVDEHNIQDFKRTNLRQHFGMVLQDTWLFNGSIMENLRYGDLNASDEEVIEAAKAAHVDHFIKTLPDGYDALMNENSDNISQGQKQLLTIARAILADRPILILDEATSSVDTRTESLIQSAMDHLMAGRTSFIIAHRLSTIRNADTILVMRDGDIVEQGNHEELLEKNGFYADLYNSQFSDAAE